MKENFWKMFFMDLGYMFGIVEGGMKENGRKGKWMEKASWSMKMEGFMKESFVEIGNKE